jgi:malonate decarboxylase beta subunit
MRAICEARIAGVPVIGLVGGRAGAFGGGGLIAGTCSALVVTEQARIGVSGPEVIETNHGVEEFDSRDRALVWRVTGGKHRALTGGADAFADDTAASLRDAALGLIDTAPPFDRASLRAEHDRLRDRLDAHGGAGDPVEIWRALGVEDDVAALEPADFGRILEKAGERHGAR